MPSTHTTGGETSIFDELLIFLNRQVKRSNLPPKETQTKATKVKNEKKICNIPKCDPTDEI